MTTQALPDRLWESIEYLVDERVGIIRTVEELPREPGAPDFFHYYAEACCTAAFTHQHNFNNSGGASVDRGLALAKAIGEGVERYCSAIYDAHECPLTSFDSTPFPCIAPVEFALYGEEQYDQPDFPYRPFVETTPIRWSPALDPLTQKTWHVPAAMVYMPYAFDEHAGEHAICQRMSTGLACHGSYADASRTAICEVIERDAFTITWQGRLGHPQILLDSLDDRNRNLVARFERTENAVTLLHLAMDHAVPTILSVAKGRLSDAPALVFAAASDLNPQEAVRKSLEELAHTRRLAQELKTHWPRFVPSREYENVVDQDSHVHLYCEWENTPQADFLFSSQARIDFQEIDNLATGDSEQDVQKLADQISAVNRRVLLADLTSSDVQELGLRVVRAVIPGFHPLFIGHNLRALGGSRLWEVPQRLGYPGITRSSGDNPAPHPFP